MPKQPFHDNTATTSKLLGQTKLHRICQPCKLTTMGSSVTWLYRASRPHYFSRRSQISQAKLDKEIINKLFFGVHFCSTNAHRTSMLSLILQAPLKTDKRHE